MPGFSVDGHICTCKNFVGRGIMGSGKKYGDREREADEEVVLTATSRVTLSMKYRGFS